MGGMANSEDGRKSGGVTMVSQTVSHNSSLCPVWFTGGTGAIFALHTPRVMKALAAGMILIVSSSSGVLTASLRPDGEDDPPSQQIQ